MNCVCGSLFYLHHERGPMPYCLACGKLRETRNGFCQQCNDDEMLRKHPGWKTKGEVLKEQQRLRKEQAQELLI